MTLSVIVHALIMLWIVLAPRVASQLPTLTEITLIEPGEAAGATAAAPAPVAATRTGAAAVSPLEQAFPRLARHADITPEPENSAALDDRIASRLAALQNTEAAPVRGIAVAAMPAPAWGAPANVSAGTGGGTAPLALHRDGTGSGAGPALVLSRGGTSLAPALANTGLPSEASERTAPARTTETAARRSLAGAMLAGPIADRPVVSWVRPVYPDWAKHEAVEGSVTLYFIVRPDGAVMDNVLVQKTAGFEDFDESARVALRAWRFEPLHQGRTGEQWGTITFHFRLREAG
ncbi:MAG: TonB family protein [Candidatus Eisenbacteria bacterium]|uniref:TonB family protein n=1 Tax=Eiseniibacteriota bacterium TaxID=2212470 RepID=A0A9D6L8B8_UNCEI|nr:TonB family protein [Candidatus Eisenbacteria bacterium]